VAFIADPRDNKGMSTLPDGRVLYSQVRPYTVPETLEELTGPTRGVVALPIMLAWTGRREFDITDPDQMARMYKVVLEEGLLDDLRVYINGAMLRQLWPEVRVARRVRQLWEEHFFELAG